MQKTAEITEDSMLWLLMRLTFFASVHKLSHITECHSLLLLLHTPLFPPSLTHSPSADLCGEERGD